MATCRVLGSLKTDILVEKTRAVAVTLTATTEQVGDDARARLPEGIPAWISRM